MSLVPSVFPLVVDNFGVKHARKEDAQHLMEVPEEHYTISRDWQGERYNDITLAWDYAVRKVHLSMPEYVNSFTVNAVYLQHGSDKFRLVQRRRARRAHAGKYVRSPTCPLHRF